MQRVQALLAQRRPATGPLDATLEQLRSCMAPPQPPAAAPAGDPGQRGPAASAWCHSTEVLAFEAADKYVRVLLAQGEVLIRTPLKELMPQLDPAVFWQIHRGTVVRAEAIDSVTRNEAGRLSLKLRARPEAFAVSRLYADRFRAM